MKMMTTKNIEKRLEEISSEIGQLRSLVLGVVYRDKEGVYKSNFVRSVLENAEKRPTGKFKNAKAFLSALRK